MKITRRQLRQIIQEEVNKQDPSSYVPWAEEAHRLGDEIEKARQEYMGWYENMKSKKGWYQKSFLNFFDIPHTLVGRDHAALIRSRIADIKRYHSETLEGQAAEGYLETLFNALDAHASHIESVPAIERQAFIDWAMDNRPDLLRTV